MKVIGELPDGTITLPEPPSVHAADWRLLRDGDRYELRLTVKLEEGMAHKVYEYLKALGTVLPEQEAFGTKRDT